MKEKRYILPDEKTDAAFAAEPTPAYHGNAALVLPENEVDEIEDDDIDWDRIPVGFYPANEEESIARIEAAEAAYERGEYIDAEEFDKELKAKIEAAEAEYELTGKDTNWEDFIEELKGEGLWLI